MSPSYSVAATARVRTTAERVYRIIADYREGHPRILPKQFTSLVVEQGGVGAGTIIRCEMRLMGHTQTFRAAVTEPEPGRVLRETIIEGDPLVTTFTVVPTDNGRECDVTIQSTVPVKRGVRGVVERFFVPRMLAPIYQEELRRLDDYAISGNSR
jgi:hypothetical protein